MVKADRHYDVVVAGAGIVGSATALLLRHVLRQAMPQLRIAIVESSQVDTQIVPTAMQRFQDANFFTQPWRVSALGLGSRALLAYLGMWDDLVALGVCPFHDMVVNDADGSGRLGFNAAQVGEGALGYLIENTVLLALLRNRCLEDGGIDFLSGQIIDTVVVQGAAGAVGDAPVTITVGGQDACSPNDFNHNACKQNGAETILSAGLLIAAEGRDSRVRMQLGLTQQVYDYEQLAIVCQIKTERPHQWCAFQSFHDTGPLAFLPLSCRNGFDPLYGARWPLAGSSEQRCSIVWSLPTERANQWLTEKKSDWLEALCAAAPAALGRIIDSSSLAAFPLQGRLSRELYKGQVVLVGDAAQTYHPMAGQGLNVGLMDAAVLVDILSEHFERYQLLGHEMALQAFVRARRFQQSSLFALTSHIHKLYQQPNWLVQLGRNAGLNAVNQIPLLKKAFVRQANAHRSVLPRRYRAAGITEIF